MEEAIHLLVQQMAAGGNLTDATAFATDVQAREALGGTCVGGGLAIPHAKSAAVRAPGLAALTLDPPLDCKTPDGAPVRMLFLIAARQMPMISMCRCWPNWPPCCWTRIFAGSCWQPTARRLSE